MLRLVNCELCGQEMYGLVRANKRVHADCWIKKIELDAEVEEDLKRQKLLKGERTIIDQRV